MKAHFTPVFDTPTFTLAIVPRTLQATPNSLVTDDAFEYFFAPNIIGEEGLEVEGRG